MAILDVDLADRLRFVTMRLARVLRQQADPDTGLSQSLLSALATISRAGPVTLGGLADLERVQPPSMTRIVDKLEGRGLVARHVDDGDRRVAHVGVLPEGERLLAALRAQKTGYLAARLADLAPADRRALAAALPALEHLASAGVTG